MWTWDNSAGERDRTPEEKESSHRSLSDGQSWLLTLILLSASLQRSLTVIKKRPDGSRQGEQGSALCQMTDDINSPPHQQSKDNLDPLSASVSYWFPWKVNITGNAGPSQEWPPNPHFLWFYLTPVISDSSAEMENGAFVLFNCCYCACRRIVD